MSTIVLRTVLIALVLSASTPAQPAVFLQVSPASVAPNPSIVAETWQQQEKADQ